MNTRRMKVCSSMSGTVGRSFSGAGLALEEQRNGKSQYEHYGAASVLIRSPVDAATAILHCLPLVS